MEQIQIDKTEIKKLSIEVQKDLAAGLVNAYLNGNFTLQQLLTNARYYGLEDLIDWETLKKPKYLLEGQNDSSFTSNL